MPNNPTYPHVLREIDRLREKGIANSDPQMMKLRMQLRDHLEKLNKNKPKTIVPTLMSVRTVKFEQPQTKSTLAEIGAVLGEKKDYALLGVAIAILALAYMWYRKDS